MARRLLDVRWGWRVSFPHRDARWYNASGPGKANRSFPRPASIAHTARLSGACRRGFVWSTIMTAMIDELGKVHGDRLVIAKGERSHRGVQYWICRCLLCGAEHSVRGVALRQNAAGRCLSCASKKAPKYRTHGMTKSAEFRAWSSMIRRCTNSNDDRWDDYGGRGITVSERWMTFDLFFVDMGHRPSIRHSIERLDNNKGYDKANCVWATPEEQNNNKRTNAIVQFDGRMQSVSRWAKERGIKYATLFSRIKRGWSVERALTEPIALR